MLKSLIQKPLPVELLDYGNPLIKGLVGCWLMNEGVGKIINCSSGFALNSTSVNGIISWTTGKHGPAVNFNNTGSFNMPTAPTQCIGTKPRTIIVSFNAASFDTDIGNSIYMLGNGGAGLGSYFGIYAEDNGVSLGVSGHRVIWNKSNLSTNKYYQFAVTFPGNTTSANFTGYIDGLRYNFATEAGAAQTVNTTGIHVIGGEAPPAYFDGLIEYLYLYDRALSASEIQQLNENPFCIFKQINFVRPIFAPVTVGGVVNVAGQADITTSSLAGFRRNRPGAAQADINTLSYAGILREHVAAAQADIVTSSFAGFRRERVAAGQSDIMTSSTAGLWRNRPIAGDIVIVTSSTAGLWRDRPMAGESAVLISTTAGMRQSLGCTANIVTSSLAGFRRNRVAACESSILTQSYAGMRRLDIPGAGTANIVTATYAGMTGGLAVSLEEIFRNRRFRDSGVFARRRMKGAF